MLIHTFEAGERTVVFVGFFEKEFSLLRESPWARKFGDLELVFAELHALDEGGLVVARTEDGGRYHIMFGPGVFVAINAAEKLRIDLRADVRVYLAAANTIRELRDKRDRIAEEVLDGFRRSHMAAGPFSPN